MKNTMTVAELIQALSTFAPDAKVVVQTHDDEQLAGLRKAPKAYIISEDDDEQGPSKAPNRLVEGSTVCLLDVTNAY